MALQSGDTGRVHSGAFKRFDISYTPWEDNVVLTPTGPYTSSLPTTQATGLKVDFIVTEDRLPTITPNVQFDNCAFPVVGGYNPTAASITINYIWYLNDVAIGSGSGNTGVPLNSRNWMVNMYRFPKVNVGDKITVLMWASAVGLTFEYMAMYIVPTKMQFTKKGTIMKDLVVGNHLDVRLTANWTSPYDGVNHGNLSSPNAGSAAVYACISSSVNYFNTNVNVNANGYNFPYLHAIYDYQVSSYYGDVSPNANNYTHSSLKYYIQPRLPAWIQFREAFA